MLSYVKRITLGRVFAAVKDKTKEHRLNEHK